MSLPTRSKHLAEAETQVISSKKIKANIMPAKFYLTLCNYEENGLKEFKSIDIFYAYVLESPNDSLSIRNRIDSFVNGNVRKEKVMNK